MDSCRVGVVVFVACVACGHVAANTASQAASTSQGFRPFAELIGDDWESTNSGGPGGDLKRHIGMEQRHLPDIRREYIVHVPDAYIAQETPGREQFPVLWYFHGQGQTPARSIRETDYSQVADHNNYFVVYPKGIGHEDGGLEGTGWNVGTAGDDSICHREAWSEFGCNCTSCYKSCQTLGLCKGTTSGKDNKCGWSTCYDDVAFVKAIIKDLKNNFAIDEKRMFMSGCSNGGMLVHYLYGVLNTTFRAAIPNYGLPLTGYLKLPPTRMSFLAIHDRWDYTIPIRGGVSMGEGWIYESLANVMEAFGKLHECDTSTLVDLHTPHTGGPRLMQCAAFRGCKTENGVAARLGTVGQCLWDGYHGDWPKDGLIAKLTFWYIKKIVLGETDTDDENQNNDFGKADSNDMDDNNSVEDTQLDNYVGDNNNAVETVLLKRESDCPAPRIALAQRR